MQRLNEPNHNIKEVISFGGRQSNHMLAVANLAHQYNLKFSYFTPPASTQSQSHTFGNLHVSFIRFIHSYSH